MVENHGTPRAYRGLLEPDVVSEVRALADAAEQYDRVEAIGEQSLLHLTDPGADVVHVTTRDDAGRLVGYAQLDLALATGELVVHPHARRRGHGSALLAAVREEAARTDVGAPSVWAHGNLPGARALAADAGMSVVRELWKMALDLTARTEVARNDVACSDLVLDDGAPAAGSGDAAAIGNAAGTGIAATSGTTAGTGTAATSGTTAGTGTAVGTGATAVAGGEPLRPPTGVRVRTFVVGADEEAWLRVNARAFADHPEQGRLTLEDLRARQREPWFDPDGFLLAVTDTAVTAAAVTADTAVTTGAADTDTDTEPAVGHPRDDAAGLLAYAWTKVEPGSIEGELYVLGVDPDAQGRGLGRLLTAMTLDLLAARGLHRAVLYTEATNHAAVRTYTSAGFTVARSDVQYR